MADTVFAPQQKQLKVPSFRVNAQANDPFGINIGSSTPFQPQGGNLQQNATASFGNNGAQFGNNATMNQNATPPSLAPDFKNPLGGQTFDITKTPIFQAQQQATMRQLDPNQKLPGFDAQANIARDAQKVAQMQAAKAARDQLIGQGMKDTGQYIEKGILDPAQEQIRQRSELERGLASTREGLVQSSIAQGQSSANQLTGQMQAQNSQLLSLGAQMQEADKNRVFQTQMKQMEQAFAEKGTNFTALMNSLKDLPEEQAADIMNKVAIDSGITHLAYDDKGQPVIDPATGKQAVLPGLQNYKSLYAAKALPILSTFTPTSRLTEEQVATLSQGWDSLKGMNSPNMASDWDAVRGLSVDQKSIWAKNNYGKLIKSPNGRIYTLVDKRIVPNGAKYDPMVIDSATGQLTFLDENGNPTGREQTGLKIGKE